MMSRKISFYPLRGDCNVWMGTYAEFVIPFLVVVGLFTRLSALAMMGFIAVTDLMSISNFMVHDGQDDRRSL